jgi:hypothetical protein
MLGAMTSSLLTLFEWEVNDEHQEIWNISDHRTLQIHALDRRGN